MEPRLIFKPAFSVIGLSHDGVRPNGYRDALWEALGARYPEMPHADPDAGFGVHTWNADGHRYLAGLALRGAGPTPVGMVSLSIGPHAYAVFAHAGRAHHLDETIRRVYVDWLPGSGYRLAENLYFEYYDDRFIPGSEQSLLFLFIPVQS